MKLHNTLSGQLEKFTPQSTPVTIYTCGPTVYNEPHVGNWVAFIRWDTLMRVLHANGFETNRVMNITDVGHLTSDADEGEDKMLKGARREGITEWEVAARYTESFIDGMEKLNLLPPDTLSKATDHIADQIDLVKLLESKGFTYVLDDGVYFDTAKFPTYADFAHLDLDAQKAGARVEFNTGKKSPSDFVLWRLTPKGETRNMEWDSPWGRGIPGWHIECSAMAMRYLGETIDIHTGGIDHIPVHHTNEIAQSEAATGKLFSRFWLHANFLLSNGTKISKSLDNGYTLADLESRGYNPMDFRMFILQSNYRSESNFTFDNLEAAHNRLSHWKEVAELRWQIHDTLENDDDKDNSDISGKLLACKQAALEALNEDLNTPQALSIIDEAFSGIDSSNADKIQQSALVALLEWIDDVLGLRLMLSTPDIDEDAKQLLVSRARARDNKDWSQSDKLRNELAARGIKILDGRTGQIWTRQS